MFKIKLITGFRRDQEYSVDLNEAHKAYYLFLHPEQRGVFSSGLAIKGDQIQEIVPDYQGTMGWTPTHVLDSDDHVELARKGIDIKIKRAMAAAKEIAQLGLPEDLNTPLSALLKSKYEKLGEVPQKRVGGMQRIGDIKKIEDMQR